MPRITNNAGELTFEGDNDNFLLPVAAPLFELSECVYEDAGIDDDDVGILFLNAAFARVEILSSTLPRTSTGSHWTLFLVPLIGLIGGRVGSGSSKPDTADGELATLGVRVRALTISPAVVVVVSVVVARRGSRDRLFELFDLVGEESSTESAGHSKLARLDTRVRPLIRVCKGIIATESFCVAMVSVAPTFSHSPT
jgi:hypothetical protein